MQEVDPVVKAGKRATPHLTLFQGVLTFTIVCKDYKEVAVRWLRLRIACLPRTSPMGSENKINPLVVLALLTKAVLSWLLLGGGLEWIIRLRGAR